MRGGFEDGGLHARTWSCFHLHRPEQILQAKIRMIIFEVRYYTLVTPVSNHVLVTKGRLSEWTCTANVTSMQQISTENL